jgi:hypothetical protein
MQNGGMPSLLSRTMLFLSSYAPLFTILAIRNWDTRFVASALLVLAIGSVAWLLVFLRQARRLAPISIEIARAASRDGDIVSYIVSYLLPFLAIDFGRPADVLSLAVLLVVIALLYVHSNLIYVNPLLAALGYHLAEIEETNGKISILLSHRPYVRPNTRLRVVPAGDLISMEAPDE